MQPEYRFSRSQGEVGFFIAFVAIASIGGWLHSPPTALFGGFGAFTAGSLFLWQRECLKNLHYVRRLPVRRANFGERLSMDTELSNDKLLPLPWVRVTNDVPLALFIAGALPEPTQLGRAHLVQVFAMLPYQRTRRIVIVHCDQRGRHLFGTSEVASSDPLGIQQRSQTMGTEEILIVYPKIFAISAPSFPSLTPIGELVTSGLIEDATRVAGVRSYRPGDPMRHIDWRASARSNELLVRDFEPTTTLRVVAFIDISAAHERDTDEDEREFTIAFGASLISHFATKRIATGLFLAGTAEGLPVAYQPSTSPDSLATMLELLALCQPDPTVSLASIMASQAARLRPGTSVLVVSSAFSRTLLAGIAECRRRVPVTALVIEGSQTLRPPRFAVDALYTAPYISGWRQIDHVPIAQ